MVSVAFQQKVLISSQRGEEGKNVGGKTNDTKIFVSLTNYVINMVVYRSMLNVKMYDCYYFDITPML